MLAESDVLHKLIASTYQGSVFGPGQAFGVEAIHRMPAIRSQINAIADLFGTELYACIKQGLPNISEVDINKLLKEIGPKAVCFCPALAAGELEGEENTRRLAGAASAIGVMYFADQTMDRGDETMALAIELLCGVETNAHKTYAEAVGPRYAALQRIKSNIATFARPEDRDYVRDCYENQVLHNGVTSQHLSARFAVLSPQNQASFLNEHATRIAELMVITGGFPSVSASLYAIYRQNDPTLPPLAEVHGAPVIQKLLRICNAVVRLADEIGDWRVDAGHHPEWGVFSINPFNQYHPDLVDTLCRLADITASHDVALLQDLCAHFHDSPATRREAIKVMTEFLFRHARDQINAVSSGPYSLYVTLCKRVLEIGKVNMLGDQALAA